MPWHILRHASWAELAPRVIRFREVPFIDDVYALAVPRSVIQSGRPLEARPGVRVVSVFRAYSGRTS